MIFSNQDDCINSVRADFQYFSVNSSFVFGGVFKANGSRLVVLQELYGSYPCSTHRIKEIGTKQTQMKVVKIEEWDRKSTMIKINQNMNFGRNQIISFHFDLCSWIILLRIAGCVLIWLNEKKKVILHMVKILDFLVFIDLPSSHFSEYKTNFVWKVEKNVIEFFSCQMSIFLVFRVNFKLSYDGNVVGKIKRWF